MTSNAWHNKAVSEVFSIFQTSEKGLSSSETDKRLKKYGSNSLPEAKPENFLFIFLRQFKNPLIYILFGASLIVFLLGRIVDGAIIIFVLLFNSLVGSFQEGKAQNTLASLKKFIETSTSCLRDGKTIVIPDKNLVPGDIIILKEGDKVPADARIIISRNLKANESSLTGESSPVHKIAEIIDNENIPLAERKNMIYKGTFISSGHGRAVVTATGVNSYIGKISKEIYLIDTEIPLKVEIKNLSNLIIYFVALICLLIFILGLVMGNSAIEMFTAVVSLSVSIIPEGLPIVITLVLAVGVWKMGKRNALIKKLHAVEALGQARVIAVDKTGTITKNELAVSKIYANKNIFNVSGSGYENKGEITLKDKSISNKEFADISQIAKISALASDANVAFNEQAGDFNITGDPTEAAMLVFSKKAGIEKEEIKKEMKKIGELPFDYKTKLHLTAYKATDNYFIAIAGAPEIILKNSFKVYENGEERIFTESQKKDIEKIFINFAEEGLRVVALAYASGKNETDLKSINEYTFAGLLGIKDELRPEVKEAVSKVISAGVRVVMITGDYKITARSIAFEAGIFKNGDDILTGEDLDMISDEELRRRLDNTTVFARVTPEHKLRIIKAYKKKGEIIAMTGDGVNDAPSLVAADLGIAMGKIGTEVAKEAADIVILDDNFISIVAAIEEGRNIYKTVKKVILYLFSTSTGEVLVIAGALVIGFPLPILPAQIIWLNLVTDGFLDVSLAMEPMEKGLLKGSFERPKRYLVDNLMVKRMFIMALPMMIGTLCLFNYYYQNNLAKAWTVSLTALAVFQWFNAWNCRSESRSLFKMNFLSNKYLISATFIVIILQMSAIYLPFMQKILKTTPLTLNEWLIIILVGFTIVLAEELRKAWPILKNKFNLSFSK